MHRELPVTSLCAATVRLIMTKYILVYKSRSSPFLNDHTSLCDVLSNIVAHLSSPLSTPVLKNYRTNVRSQNLEVIKKRPMRTTPGSLTIAQVNEMLDRLAQASKE